MLDKACWNHAVVYCVLHYVLTCSVWLRKTTLERACFVMYRKKSVKSWSGEVELSGRWRLAIWRQVLNQSKLRTPVQAEISSPNLTKADSRQERFSRELWPNYTRYLHNLIFKKIDINSSTLPNPVINIWY